MKIWKNKSLSPLTLYFDGVVYTEQWKQVIGFVGLYDVSSFGRIKSLEREVPEIRYGKRTIKEKILAISKYSNGYLGCSLWANNSSINCLVHRLVGESFLPNYYNLPEINHKYGDKEDNFYLHIEWNTHSNNIKHSYDVLNRTPPCSMRGKIGNLHPNSKPIYCPTLGLRFESSRIAEKVLGISQGSISDICRGKLLQRDGLIFNFI